MYSVSAKKLSGSVVVPPSKSFLHRALMCAALSKGKSVISNILLSDDILATIDFIKSIGADVKVYDDKIEVTGFVHEQNNTYFANESGTTLRLSIPLLIHLTNNFKIKCSESLIKRPLDVYNNLFGEININDESLVINHQIKPGKFVVDGSKSSQFISGLLLCLPLLNGNSTIEVTGIKTSESYIDITIDVLKQFGIKITEDNNKYFIEGNQQYNATNYFVEADYSQAAFFLVANKLGSNINVEGLNKNSIQGDRKILEYLNNNSQTIDVTDTPDLVPVLSVYLSSLEHNTLLVGTKRLKYKESDRAIATKELIQAIGGCIDINDDSMLVYGNTNYHKGSIKAYNDHRIAMSACIASTLVDSELELDNIKCINKSYTTFIEEFKRLGGIVNVK